MDGKTFVDNAVAELHNQTLAHVVELLEKSNIGLSKEDKNKLAEGKRNVSYGYRTQIDTFKEQLASMWANYNEPTQTLHDCVSEYESFRIRKCEEHDNAESVRRAAAIKSGTPYYPRPPPYCPDFGDKPYRRFGDKFFAMDLETGRCKDECLLNPLNFQITDLKDCIIINDHNKSLNILESTKRILLFCQELGLGKDRCANLLQSMIREYSPRNAGIFSFISSPLDTFNAICGMVHYSSEINAIKTVVSMITREVGEALETPIQKYLSLLLNASALETPTMSNDQAIDKANKKCIKCVDFLVEENTCRQLQRMKREVFVRLNTKSTLDDVIKFVANLESDPMYELKRPKTLANKPVHFSLYHTDTMADVPSSQNISQAEHSDTHHGADSEAIHPRPVPHIQHHGGSHQHFYGGNHQHGAEAFMQVTTSQVRNEYFQEHPVGSSYQYGASQQQTLHDDDQLHHHHNGDHHRTQHDDDHQPQQPSRPLQYDNNFVEVPPPPAPQEVEHRASLNIAPEFFFQHRDGRFTRLDLRSLWIRDPRGKMYCLDEKYYSVQNGSRKVNISSMLEDSGNDKSKSN